MYSEMLPLLCGLAGAGCAFVMDGLICSALDVDEYPHKYTLFFVSTYAIIGATAGYNLS